MLFDLTDVHSLENLTPGFHWFKCLMFGAMNDDY